MADLKLTSDEAAVIRAVLSKLTVRTRTGEVGITHGANRFVSTQLCLSKSDRARLGAAAAKLGLKQGVPEIS